MFRSFTPLLLVVALAGLPSRADDEVLARARAAQAAAKQRGPIVVPKGEGPSSCFVPKPLEGAACAKGLRLCRAELSSGSCDGYGSQTVSLVVVYDGEPAATQFGVNGDRGGLPLSQEAGPDLEFERSQCGARGFGVGRLAPRADAGEAERASIEALNKKNEEAAARANAAERDACLARVEAETKRAREWQRCELLSVDACRREAFLECRGNVGQRGLLRASWSQPKDRPANETLRVRAMK